MPIRCCGSRSITASRASATGSTRRSPTSRGPSCPDCSISIIWSANRLGTRQAEDAWVDHLSRTIFEGTAEQAADAAAAALAEGMAPDAIGEAISLAANQLVLRDAGRTAREAQTNKPVGSVHGDSIGVQPATRPMPGETWPRSAIHETPWPA